MAKKKILSKTRKRWAEGQKQLSDKKFNKKVTEILKEQE